MGEVYFMGICELRFQRRGHYLMTLAPRRCGAGKAYTVLLDPEGVIWSWGSNSYGQLASGDTIQRDQPEQQKILPPLLSLGIGTGHCLALSQTGQVWAWGWNRFGQLATKEVQVHPQIIQFPRKCRVLDVAAGSYHSLALTSDGVVFSMGIGPQFQVRQEADRYRLKEVKGYPELPLPRFVSIDAGESHSAALDEAGSLWTWGFNADGCVAQPNQLEYPHPMPLSTLPDPVIHFACGGRNTVVVDSKGNVWIWGDNRTAQLAQPVEVISSHRPLQVKLPRCHRVALGGGRVVVLDHEGKVWTWGSNRHSCLGVNSPDYSVAVPTQVPLSEPMHSVVAGLTHSIAIDFDGHVWAWGSNASGELGLEHTNPVPEPHRIELPFVLPHQVDRFAKTKRARAAP